MEFRPERSVYLNDEINSQSSLEVIMGISKLSSADPAAPITLFITSSGGNVVDAFALYEYMTKLLKPNLQTVVLGEASSMAVILFLMGEKRHVGSMTVLRLHRFTFTPDKVVPLTARQLEKLVKNLIDSETKYGDILVQRTGGKISRQMANDLLDGNTVITAARAVELGLAHEIL